MAGERRDALHADRRRVLPRARRAYPRPPRDRRRAGHHRRGQPAVGFDTLLRGRLAFRGRRGRAERTTFSPPRSAEADPALLASRCQSQRRSARDIRQKASGRAEPQRCSSATRSAACRRSSSAPREALPETLKANTARPCLKTIRSGSATGRSRLEAQLDHDIVETYVRAPQNHRRRSPSETRDGAGLTGQEFSHCSARSQKLAASAPAAT